MRLRGASGSVITFTGRLGRPLPPNPAPEAAFNRNWYQVLGLRSESTAPTFVVLTKGKQTSVDLLLIWDDMLTDIINGGESQTKFRKEWMNWREWHFL